jgi:diguanylate cyclase (GGDEF)-like protein/PAS domain S-box-containing protein
MLNSANPDIQDQLAGTQQSETILSSISDAFFALDQAWNFTYANSFLEPILGRKSSELLGKNIWLEFPELVSTQTHKQYHTAVKVHTSVEFEEYYPRINKWLLVRVYPSKDGISVYMTDITARRLSEESLRKQEELYRFFTENSDDLISLLDQNGKFEYVSPTSIRLLGYIPSELVGKTIESLAHPDDIHLIHEGLAALTTPPFVSTATFRMQKKDKSYVWLETIHRIYRRGHEGEILQIVANSRDITERKHSEDAIHHMAFHDALTRLPNRLLLQDRLDAALVASQKTGSLVALMFIDLDRFKVVNDTLGHQMGDRILQDVSGRLIECAGPENTVARFGGDEFLVMAPNLPDIEAVTALARCLLDALQPASLLDGHEIHLSASIGIAVYPSDGETSEVLMKNADNAVYQAKESGRNNFQLFTPTMHLKASARMLLENGLRKTLERNELQLYYQPIIRLEDEKTVIAEALLRWHHPVKGVILPGEFIPLAEETGIITQIGEWILHTAALQIKTWKDEGITPPIISVNISPRQFKDASFLDSLHHIVKQYDIHPEDFQLEITESVAMDNVDESIPKLRALKDAGFRIAIDDFGSGYSSLNYLKQLPLDCLKIDKSFTDESNSTSNDETIVQAIISLGHTLGLSVCAEGIESKSQYGFFKSHNCDLVQGFYIAKPQPVTVFTKNLVEKNFQVPANTPGIK